MSETDWTQEITDPGSEEGASRAAADLAFSSLPAFVEDFFLEVCLRHEVSAWCPKWWDHEEAVLRLEALWDAFEALRQEPGTGTAVWIRDYLDPTVAVLTSPETTPFRGCDARRGAHQVAPALTAAPPPHGMFFTSTSTSADEEDSSAETGDGTAKIQR